MNVFSNHSFQTTFFEQLEKQFDKRGQMVIELSEVLNVGRDAIYRRLRGDTVLSADELILLAKKYNIDLNFDQNRQELYYNNPAYETEQEVDYFRQLARDAGHIIEIEGISIDYATPELPIYYDLLAPTLLAFKVYVYGLTSWNFSKWKGKPFHPSLVSPEVNEIARQLSAGLFQLPGRELWSVGIFDITLRQVVHAVETGRLENPGLVKTIFKEIDSIINHMEEMAGNGKRYLPGEQDKENLPDFQVFHNELTNTNNVIIVKSPKFSSVFSTFVNPNYIVCKDKRIQQQIENWFENLVESSNSLNATGGKYKEKYFNQLRRAISTTQQKVEALFLLQGIAVS